MNNNLVFFKTKFFYRIASKLHTSGFWNSNLRRASGKISALLICVTSCRRSGNRISWSGWSGWSVIRRTTWSTLTVVTSTTDVNSVWVDLCRAPAFARIFRINRTSKVKHFYTDCTKKLDRLSNKRKYM